MDQPASSQESVVLDAARPEIGEQQIRQLCTSLLPGWSNLDASSLQVDKMSGGISNLLVKVTPAGEDLGPVAVKVFGQKTELLIDRAAELDMLLQLNRAGFGAKVVAIFGNGRIEEFMNAYTLTPQDMSSPLFVPRIAQRLRQLHDVRMTHPGGQGDKGQPQLFDTIRSWLAMARALQFEDSAKQKAFEQVDLTGMAAEVDELQQLCTAAASPTVFSHNDLLSGNILVLQGPNVDGSRPSQVNLQGPLQFIDFEYSAPSYRGFDLGNHFNEYAGFDCDYSQYPGPEAQALFFRHYLATSPPHAPRHPPLLAEQQQKGREGAGSCTTECLGSAAASMPAMLVPPHSEVVTVTARAGLEGEGSAQPVQQELLQGTEEVSLDALNRLSAEANLFALASHAYWGIWALIQARYSPIDFDYFDYSGLRWAEYHRRKPQFVASAKQMLGIA